MADDRANCDDAISAARLARAPRGARIVAVVGDERRTLTIPRTRGWPRRVLRLARDIQADQIEILRGDDVVDVIVLGADAEQPAPRAANDAVAQHVEALLALMLRAQSEAVAAHARHVEAAVTMARSMIESADARARSLEARLAKAEAALESAREQMAAASASDEQPALPEPLVQALLARMAHGGTS